MPEFVAENQKAFFTLKVMLTKQPPPKNKPASFKSFATVQFTKSGFTKYVAEVARKINREIHWHGVVTLDTDEKGLAQLLFNSKHKIAHHAVWYPYQADIQHRKYVYRGGPNPEYPIYIISKGRWETPLTARALSKMGVPFTIVVEPKEAHEYRKQFAAERLQATVHIAPENFSERGCGSVPVRNYVWDLAVKTGKARHWLLDDNIPAFYRMNRNLKIQVRTGAIFRAAEDFVDRYDNVPIAGFQSHQFAITKWQWPPYVLNQRVYSCTLIQNNLDLPEGRFRGRYNEDTDWCIRVLKAGQCTVLFNAFQIHKVGTMTMKGGNTDELYAGNGRELMAESLELQHPDVVRVTRRWNRWQHSVNYKPFKNNPLKLREGAVVPEGVNNYGMACFERKTGKTVTLAANDLALDSI